MTWNKVFIFMADLVDTNVVRKSLKNLCVKRQLITYKDLVSALGIQPPQSIQQLVRLLESCQEDDAALQQPQIVSVVVQKTGLNYPRSGYFQKLTELGLYSGPDEGLESQMWHQNELEKVFAFYGE
ncbi:MAG: hypothetical protein ACI9S6_001458 [Reinekea sp.]